MATSLVDAYISEEEALSTAAQFCAILQEVLRSVLRSAQQPLQVLRVRITRLREEVAFLCGSA